MKLLFDNQNFQKIDNTNFYVSADLYEMDTRNPIGRIMVFKKEKGVITVIEQDRFRTMKDFSKLVKFFKEKYKKASNLSI